MQYSATSAALLLTILLLSTATGLDQPQVEPPKLKAAQEVGSPEQPATPAAHLVPQTLVQRQQHLLLHLRCPRGCERHGNCNLETGRCDCPFGYGSQDCSRHLLSACRLADLPGAVAEGGDWPEVVHSCECLRQYAAYVQGMGDAIHAYLARPDALCFHRSHYGPDSQLSNLPGPSETGIVWYKGYQPGGMKVVEKPTPVIYRDFWSTEWVMHPLEDCALSCSWRGLCVHQRKQTDASPLCLCYFGFQSGPFQGCEVQRPPVLRDQPLCPNGCSGAGACRRGWCHCQAGRFGMDCSRTQAYALQPQRQPSHRLRIYVYELPAALIRQGVYTSLPGFHSHDGIYIAETLFLAELMADWRVRTQDPNEATLFYVPAFTLDYTNNLGDPSEHLLLVKRYLQRRWPFWNETNGQGHVFWTAGDIGACQLPEELSNATFITHYCRMGQDARYRGECFNPLKDVCAAPFLDVGEQRGREMYPTQRHAAHTLRARNGQGGPESMHRPTLFFFAGDTRPDLPHYSGGVRQELARLAAEWKDPALRVNPPDMGAYLDEIRRSVFCLAPFGNGWGIRLVTLMVEGCIPVIVQDEVAQYYEGMLPYWKFSLRLRKAELARLPQLLRAVSAEDVLELQRGMRRHHKAFLWQAGYGRAYRHTIASLRQVGDALRSQYLGCRSSKNHWGKLPRYLTTWTWGWCAKEGNWH